MKGARVSPIFGIHGVTNKIFRVDWLHAVDHGIGADFLGNLFAMIMNKFGGTKQAKADQLNTEIPPDLGKTLE